MKESAQVRSPCEMEPSIENTATASDKAAIGKVASAIRKERAIARAYKCRLDSIALMYQKQVHALSKELRRVQGQLDAPESAALLESKIDRARTEVRLKYAEKMQGLEDDLRKVQDEVRNTQADNLTKEQELSQNRQKSAVDANTILHLREELNALQETKDRVATESVEKHARNMQLLRQSKESDAKVMKYEESNVFLKSEVLRLSQELAQTRTQLDSSIAAHEAAITTANNSNSELSQDLAKSKTRALKLANELSNVERHVIDLQADFDREKADQREEIDNLTKLVEMHREATKDAEIRLAGYTEVLGTLAKEKKEADRRPAPAAGPADRHAEALFKNLNKALDAKLQVLEKERHELDRARAAEARMATRHQALIREADAARRELKDVRQQNVTLEAELSTEKDKVAELERKLMAVSSIEAYQSTPMLPFGDSSNDRRSLGIDLNTPGSGGRLATTRTPTPFRQPLGLGNAEQALAGMVEIRRRHEAILAGLREKREEYAEMMRD